MSGILFKISGASSISISKTYSYSYGAKTLDAFIDSISASSKIVEQTSSFIDSIYLRDDEGNPTTEIDPDYDEGLIHNIDMRCTASKLSIDNESISYLDIFISS